MQRTLKNIVTLVVSLVFVVALMEVVLRTTHLAGARLAWTQPDDVLGWRFTPGREYWFHNENDHAITGRINANGWRDRDRGVEKPAGTKRVAVLGDSFVEAFQVEQDSTFCALLERRFGGGVEVLNFGRSGMTQTEEYLLLVNDVMRYDPDVVVLLFVPQNDIADMDRRTTMNPMRPFCAVAPNGSLVFDTSFSRSRGYIVRRRINALKQHSALVSLVAERYNASRRAGRGTPESQASRISGYLTLCTATPDSISSAAYALSRRVIREIASTCQRHGARLVLASNYVEYRPDRVAHLRSLDATFDPDTFDRDLSALAAQTGAVSVGIQDAFSRRYREEGTPLAWVHWNYRGHETAAAALFSSIAPLVE